jgi:acyl carrier protein
MTDQAIVSRIIHALAQYLKRDAGSITEDHHLRDDLGLDSMAVIELLYKIEETFNIQIPDQDLAGLTTVSSVARYVESRTAPAEAAKSRPVKRTPAKSKTTKKKR